MAYSGSRVCIKGKRDVQCRTDRTLRMCLCWQAPCHERKAQHTAGVSPKSASSISDKHFYMSAGRPTYGLPKGSSPSAHVSNNVGNEVNFQSDVQPETCNGWKAGRATLARHRDSWLPTVQSQTPRLPGNLRCSLSCVVKDFGWSCGQAVVP